MNWKTIFTIARKDIYEARQNQSVWLPIMIVPIFFVLVMPLAMIMVASNPDLGKQMTSDPQIIQIMAKLPAYMKNVTQGLDNIQSVLVLALGYFFAPYFLILPIMFATVIASESFAGERERKTIEALLYTPATDAELFLGKVCASLIPAILITWGSFIGYTIVLDVGGYALMGRLWFPLTNWYPLIFWVSPALSLLGVSATVLISSKLQTFMGAYQTSASLVLLVIALFVGQLTGVLYLSSSVSLLLGVALFLVDAGLCWLAVRTFNRSKILASVN